MRERRQDRRRVGDDAEPQVRHIGTLRSYEHPRAGTVQVVAQAARFLETPAEIERPAPLVGEHSAEILSEIGFRADEIDALLSKKAITQMT